MRNGRLFKLILFSLAVVASVGLGVGGWALAKTISHGEKIAAIQATQDANVKDDDKFQRHVNGELQYIRKRVDQIAHGDEVSSVDDQQPVDN